MARIEWREDFFKDVLQSGQIRDAVKSEADKRAQRARAIAPVKTGRYRNSILTVVKKGKKRWYAYVYSDVPYSVPVEGYHAVMSRSL